MNPERPIASPAKIRPSKLGLADAVTVLKRALRSPGALPDGVHLIQMKVDEPEDGVVMLYFQRPEWTSAAFMVVQYEWRASQSLVELVRRARDTVEVFVSGLEQVPDEA